MLGLAAAFPNPVIRVVPDFGQVLEHLELEIPRILIELQFGHARLVNRIQQLAIDIEL